MTDKTLIRKVVDTWRFHDLAIVCKRYGLGRVRNIAGEKIALSPSLRRSFNNIEKGLARTSRTLLGEQIRSRDFYDLFVLANEDSYATSQLLHDAVTYRTNNDVKYHKAVLRGDIPLDADDEGSVPVGVKSTLEEISHYFDT